MSWIRGLWLCCVAFASNPATSIAEERVITVRPGSGYVVDGLAIGAKVAPNSAVYRRYDCNRSEQYPGFIRCRESHIENGVQVTRSILHTSNLVTWYVNKELSPAYFTASDLNAEISRLAREFGTAPHIYRLNEMRGFPKATIATFGGIELQQLKPNDMAKLAQGESPRVGILVDFLNDFRRSAKAHLPVYKLGGSEGFAWIANYDRGGAGTLRFFAADPAQMNRGEGQPSEIASQTSLIGRGKDATFMVAMENIHGVYQVPIRINDTITLDAIVDSGASDVSIPADVVLTLMRSKTISSDDFIGSQIYILADGSKVPSQRFMVKSLKVGGRTLTNVIASIASVNAQILLGQSFLNRFRSWSIDNMNHTLTLN